MSSTQQPQVQMQRDERAGGGGYGKLIAAGVIGVLILIFIVQNTASVAFNFLFFDFTWPVWLMLVITLALGFLGGLLLGAFLRRRKRREMRRRAGAV